MVYTGVGYEREDSRPDPRKLAYLWLERGAGTPAVGACCFRSYDRWVMLWIWLHPFVRRKGLLRQAWPFFRSRFGDFAIQAPLSDPMSAFLDVIDPETDAVELPG
jgi:hypothetical protein